MAEYIETDFVLELVRGRIDKYRKKGVRDQLCHDTLRYLEKKIKSKPAADVVEVVRCKDCILHEDFPHTVNLYCNRFDSVVKSDGFCIYGKKDLEESE